jgi:hypothetical protein
LARLEAAYLDCLACVDQIETRLADPLQFAATKVAPELVKAQRLVTAAKSEVAVKRAKLALPVDRSDAYGLARRAELRTRRKMVARRGAR